MNCISFKFQNEIQKQKRSRLAKDEKQKLIGPIFCGIVCEERGDTKEPPKKTETDAFMMRVDDDERGYHGGGHGLDDDGDEYEVDVKTTGISSIVQNQIITMRLSMKEDNPHLLFYTNGTKIGEHDLNEFDKSKNWYWGCTIIAKDTELAIVDTPDADSKVAKLFSEEVSPSQDTHKYKGGGAFDELNLRDRVVLLSRLQQTRCQIEFKHGLNQVVYKDTPHYTLNDITVPPGARIYRRTDTLSSHFPVDIDYCGLLIQLSNPSGNQLVNKTNGEPCGDMNSDQFWTFL